MFPLLFLKSSLNIVCSRVGWWAAKNAQLLPDPHEIWGKWLPYDVIIFPKFHENWKKNVDFLPAANFWASLKFFNQSLIIPISSETIPELTIAPTYYFCFLWYIWMKNSEKKTRIFQTQTPHKMSGEFVFRRHNSISHEWSWECLGFTYPDKTLAGKCRGRTHKGVWLLKSPLVLHLNTLGIFDLELRKPWTHHRGPPSGLPTLGTTVNLIPSQVQLRQLFPS